VTDVNDNSPVFSGLQGGVIPANVNENKANGTRIIQVTATDADEGDNGRVSYSVVGGESTFDDST